MKIISKNKNLRNYQSPLDYVEAGIVLKGSEIKSIRKNGMEIKNSYVIFSNAEAYAVGIHIPEYKFATIESHNPDAKRKLLLKKNEIRKFIQREKEKGLSYIIASTYLTKSNKLKVSIAIVKGIRKVDKREIERKKEHKKETKRYY